MPTDEPRYSAYASDDGRALAVPDADSFADAALRFSEVWRAEEDDEELRVIVVDRETGERQCYCVDLGARSADPCG